MSLNELYRKFLETLQEIYDANEASAITSMVFESVAGIPRSAVLKDPTQIINETIAVKLNACLLQLMQHEPVQYVIGEAWFYKMKLKVSSAVLIPRPETEELVSAAIDHLKGLASPSVIDIGTGSGCIAIAIKKNVPHAIVSALDISDAALLVAKENAKTQEVVINFSKVDILDNNNMDLGGPFDVIISNPPYIPEQEKEELAKNVTGYEPYIALFVKNEQPLIFYEKIAELGKTHLKEEGKLFLETHEKLAGKVAALFNEAGYTTKINKDIFEKERMVIATHSR